MATKLRPNAFEKEVIRLHREGTPRAKIANATGTTENHCWAILSVFEKTVTDHQARIARAIVERKRNEARAR